MTTNNQSTSAKRRPSDWTRAREAAIDAAAGLARSARIDYDNEARINDTRADLGQAAVMVGCVDWHSDEDWRSHVSDAIANVVHFCHRAGLAPAPLIQSALRSAEGDLEDGPEASRDEARFPQEGNVADERNQRAEHDAPQEHTPTPPRVSRSLRRS